MAKKTTTSKPSTAKGTKRTDKVQTVPLTPEIEQAFKDGVLLRLIMGSPGFKAKVDSDEITAGEADTDMLHVHKSTLECDEYDAIKSLHGEIKKFLWLRSMTIKAKLMRGTYFIKYKYISEVLGGLQKFVDQHNTDLVPAFLAVYTKAKTTAKGRLKNLYDDRDYPTEDALRQAFYIQYYAMPQTEVSTKVKEVDAVLYEQMVANLQREYTEAAQLMRLELRQNLLKMTQHLKEKLSGENGEKKVLRQTAVTHITDFLQFFDAKDNTGDRGLSVIVDQLKKTMSGVEIEQLKKDDKYRAAMNTALDGVVKQLDGLVTETGRAVKLPSKKKGEAA